jgi:hypothetical protein
MDNKYCAGETVIFEGVNYIVNYVYKTPNTGPSHYTYNLTRVIKETIEVEEKYLERFDYENQN